MLVRVYGTAGETTDLSLKLPFVLAREGAELPVHPQRGTWRYLHVSEHRLACPRGDRLRAEQALKTQGWVLIGWR